MSVVKIVCKSKHWSAETDQKHMYNLNNHDTMLTHRSTPAALGSLLVVFFRGSLLCLGILLWVQ